MAELRIDGDRLWRSLTTYAEIGATSAGGVERLALSDADREARDLLVDDARAAGCEVTVDAVGNMFCRRPGRDPMRPPVQVGSHLDTVHNGGRFDGSYGVLAGLETIRTLNDAGVDTDAPVELVNWTNEEGARFPLAMTGSRVFTGQLDLADALELRDGDGVRLGSALDSIGYTGEARPGHPVAAYLETHIEQGPVLESRGLRVGLVTGIQARRRLRVRVRGTAAHAGTSPMGARHDALVAASGMVLAVRRAAQAEGADARATVGQLRVSPGAANVVPDAVEFLVDARHPDETRLARLIDFVTEAFETLAGAEGCSAETETLSSAPATRFTGLCREALRAGAAAHNEPTMEMVSGGGHDAGPMATVAPAGMLFIACRAGVSHHPDEWIEADVAAAGCQVMADALRRLAA